MCSAICQPSPTLDRPRHIPQHLVSKANKNLTEEEQLNWVLFTHSHTYTHTPNKHIEHFFLSVELR